MFITCSSIVLSTLKITPWQVQTLLQEGISLPSTFSSLSASRWSGTGRSSGCSSSGWTARSHRSGQNVSMHWHHVNLLKRKYLHSENSNECNILDRGRPVEEWIEGWTWRWRGWPSQRWPESREEFSLWKRRPTQAWRLASAIFFGLKICRLFSVQFCIPWRTTVQSGWQREQEPVRH